MDLAAFGAGFEWGSGVSLPLFSGSVLSSYLIGLSIVGVPARRESPRKSYVHRMNVQLLIRGSYGFEVLQMIALHSSLCFFESHDASHRLLDL